MDRIQGCVNGKKKLEIVDVGRYDRSIFFFFFSLSSLLALASGACFGAAPVGVALALTDARIVVSGVRWRPLLWDVSVLVSVALQ